MKEWKKVKFEEILVIKKGEYITKKEARVGIYPVILGGKEPAYFVDKYNHVGKAIVISRSGASAGYVSFWNEPIFVTDGFLIEPKNDVTYEFLYYALKSKQKLLHNVQQGAAIPHVTPRLISDIDFTLPDNTIQHRIATILSRYDSLIENYQKQIKLLEESAQRLYKEWFIDLRFPGHENTKIVDGLPEGWEKKKVGDLISKIQRTKQVSANNYQISGLYPVIDQSRNYIAGYTDESECVLNVTIPYIVFGDHTRVLKYVPFSFAKGADGTQLIMSNDLERMPQSLFYNSLIEIDLSNYSYARHFKYLKEESILVPSKDIAQRYNKVVSQYFQSIQKSRGQIHHLTEARDRLLPKLMNGEIEV